MAAAPGRRRPARRFAELADRLWRRREAAGGIDACMAFYGDCFLRPGQMGADPGQLTSAQQVFAEQLARAWLQRAAATAPDAFDRREAQRELRGAVGEAQGTGAAVRTAVAGLARLRWFAPLGMAMAERFIKRALTQVTRYFTDERVREHALGQVAKLVGAETKVLLGHSLGSVVAYEAAHHLDRPLPLLVTLGSPLGLRTIVYERLRPQPPRFPPAVCRWVNLAGRDDVIAAAPDLTALFGPTCPAAARLEGGWTVDTGRPTPRRRLLPHQTGDRPAHRPNPSQGSLTLQDPRARVTGCVSCAHG
ncbi:MAG: hypothetical protein ACRD0K_17315 [Egibacteraceae bacterium]